MRQLRRCLFEFVGGDVDSLERQPETVGRADVGEDGFIGKHNILPVALAFGDAVSEAPEDEIEHGECSLVCEKLG